MKKDRYQVELTIKYKEVPDNRREEYLAAMRWLFDQFNEIMTEKESKGNERKTDGS